VSLRGSYSRITLTDLTNAVSIELEDQGFTAD
jgi:hypothetical protein